LISGISNNDLFYLEKIILSCDSIESGLLVINYEIGIVESKMADERMLSELGDQVIVQESSSAGKKRKPSWLRTILWMLSMIVLANIVVAIVAYFLFFQHK
jgi:hypothetical protein